MIHWALRREELCDPGLCPDAPDRGSCGTCPLDKLDAAQLSESGLLIRRATDLRMALKLGFDLDLGEVPADEFFVMLLLEEVGGQLERERLSRAK